MRTRLVIAALLLSVVAGTVAFRAAAVTPVRNVRVRVMQLEGAADADRSKRLAVQVFIGSRQLYQTPFVSGSTARWNKGLRAYTALAMPLSFVVVSDGGSRVPVRPARRIDPPRRAAPRDVQIDPDALLSAGMDDFVADYGTGTLDEGAEGSASAKARPMIDGGMPVIDAPKPAQPEFESQERRVSKVCTARLKWPPAEGEHRLSCGSMTLVIAVIH